MHGHLFPAVAVLEELHRRGHEISIRALSSEVAMLRTLGFEAESLAPEVEALDAEDWRARTPPGAAISATRTFCARAAHDALDLQRAIADERPDALLVDVAAWGALGEAEAWGGPWASFCPLPLGLPSTEAPAFGPGFPPARGLLGRLRDRAVWALDGRIFDRVALDVLNQVRGRSGAEPLTRAGDLFRRPPLLLYMTAKGFEYPRADWPPSVVMVGPCAWDPPARLPARLAAVKAPFIVVTTSTDFQDDGRLVRVALDALADEPCHVVATLPAATLAGLSVPVNATVEPFLPHRPLLARASCAITHGGMGATQKALSLGVPVCAVPFGRDQFEVARRVTEANAGTQLYPWCLRPDRLRRKVRKAIASRPGAERVARQFEATGGSGTAADAFESQLLQGQDN